MGDPLPEIRPARLLELLQRLLAKYSPSGKEEAVVDDVRRFLLQHGLPVERQQVDGGRANLIVPLGEGEPRALMVGHLDTVAAFDLHEVDARREGERIHGLGAADMKGGCAAMIEAAVALWETGLRDVPVTLCLVVGEEEDGDGAERLVEEVRAPWAIVGEPTDLTPCLSHRGYAEVGIAVLGVRRHASLAGGGEEAVPAMLRLLLEVEGHVRESWPEVAFNIRGLASSPLGFVVPDRCEAALDLHLPAAAPLGPFAAQLEKVVAEASKRAAGVRFDVELVTLDEGYVLPEHGPLVTALRAALARRGLPWTTKPFQSHSDAVTLYRAGILPIVIGPGGLEQAHSSDEWVSMGQVTLAAELYADVALSLRGTAPPLEGR